MSSSYPYELQVCRLGPEVNGIGSDEVLHSFGHSPAAEQPIHPGSYLIVEKPLDAAIALPALTIEVWIRRWRTTGRQAILTQFDEAEHCGFGLFVNEDGSLSFYLGDGGSFVDANLLTSPPDQLRMQVNPQGLKNFPDNTPSSVLANHWHHVVARYDGHIKQLWVDGREVASGTFAGPLRPGSSALRIGAAGSHGITSGLLDADLAMPAIYSRAISPAEIQARFAGQGLSRPTGPDLLACWPLAEERGERVADASPHARHARIINRATWMIGGPGLDADVPRFGNYDPSKDPRRGHGLRLASDDLFDCRWKVSHEFRIPEKARSGIYVGRVRFHLGGEERLYHTVFIVGKAASRQGRPSRSSARPTHGGLMRPLRSARRGRASRSRSAITALRTALGTRRHSASIGPITRGRALTRWDSGCPGRSSALIRSWVPRSGITATSADKIAPLRPGWRRRGTTTTS